MPSENGWEPPRLAGREDMLVWKTVPGTTVNLQVMRGLPEVFIPAWAADWNEYIEGGGLRDADSASFTPTNSVATSNHLNGTACDLNWNSYPFRAKTFSAAKRSVIQEMTDFYEGWMFWAGYWDDPVDEMHSQMGYNTWNRNTAALDFISRKIRSDGKSTFRRGPLSPTDPPNANGTPQAPTPSTPSPADTPAAVLYDAVPVIDMETAQRLVSRVMDGLRLSQCSNVNRIAMWLAQIGHESEGFIYTEEIAKNGRYAPFIGRTWIQITWDYNYRAFGQWCAQQGLVSDPETFIKNPKSLADDKWAALGPAWYWTVARPKLNEMSDNGDMLGVTKAINGGTNGLADRQARYSQAKALGDRLLLLAGVNPSTPPPSQDQGDSMANVPQEQWDRVYRELTQLLPSRSPLRRLGEGPIDTMAGFTLNVDGMSHIEYIRTLAGYGHPPTLALLQEVAAAAGDSRYPDRQDDALLATAILASLTKPDTSTTSNLTPPQPSYATSTPEPVRMARVESLPEAQVETTPSTPGQIVGQAFDALHALLGEADSLTESEKTTYNALISALNTKIGVTPK